MNTVKLKILIITVLFLLVSLAGCVNYFEPLKTEPPTLGIRTESGKELQSLPVPKEKIIAAVYKFRDQTGQYKPSSVGANWSTAVTQGATSILMRALEESGWFIAIEREGLSNLLNERKIIRSSRAGFGEEGKEDSQLLPPLLFAGVILEGGIISYDSNIITGGTGLKYFGVGASGQYRQDRVTIYLRAISTNNGQILKTVYTSKTILSQMVDVGFIRFVEFKKLLEFETGYSYNEPPELCVTQAIEKAVQSLVIEGVLNGLWTLEHPEDINASQIKDYLVEKEENTKINEFGNEMLEKRTLAIGFNSGGQQYQGDYGTGYTQPLLEIFVSNSVSTNFDLGVRFGTGNLESTNQFSSKITYIGLSGRFYMLPFDRFSPYLIGGVDATYMNSENRKGEEIKLDENWAANLSIGIGAEFRVWDKFGLNADFDYNYLLSDEIDGVESGTINDYFYAFRFGFSFYPGF